MTKIYSPEELNSFSRETLVAVILSMQDQLSLLNTNMERLIEQIASANNHRYGRSSEKLDVIAGQLELELIFNEAEALTETLYVVEPAEEDVIQVTHRKKKGKREADLKDLPVEVIPHTLPEEKLQEIFGAVGWKQLPDEVYKRVRVQPAVYTVEEHHVAVYAGKDNQTIVKADRPKELLRNSILTPSLAASILNAKYVNGLPLYRISQEFLRNDIHISRQVMANWVIQCTQTWLKPLYRHMKRTLLEDAVIHADETTVQVLKENGKAATSESRMWVYASWEGSKKPIRIFEYQPDRSGKRPANFLKGFCGYLVTDGYAGYNQVKNVTHCGCWAHARRKWREAMPDGATVKTSKAAVGYRYCTKLFALDGKTSYLLPKTRNEHRQNVVRPLLEEYFCWLKTIHPEKGSKLEDAVRYSLNQAQQLTAFLDAPEIPISNNLAENAIRPFVVGRKNWLFCDSVKGAESSAIVYSIVETAKANSLEPYDYLLMVLSLLPGEGKSPSHETLERLMPWHPNAR